MKPIRFSQLKLRGVPVEEGGAGEVSIEDIKIPVFYGEGADAKNINILATDLTTGSDAIDQTFDPTSNKAQSGIALNFLGRDATNKNVSLTYDISDEGDIYKFNIAQSANEEDGPTIGFTINGQDDLQETSISFKNIQVVSDYGYIQEAGTPTSLTGTGGFIEDSIKAALENGRVINLVELNGSGAVDEKILTEGNIAYSKMNYSTASEANLDLRPLKVTRFATAEIWIDIPSDLPDSSASNKEPSFMWPVSDNGMTTWLEGSEPASLTRGNRYVIVIRNDGNETSSHYCMNLAYQYPLTNL